MAFVKYVKLKYRGIKMALIRCKECGNRISDKAVECPQCGAPIQSQNENTIGKKEWKDE